MRRTVAIVVTCACLGALAWLVSPQRPPPVAAHLLDRLWIDHVPEAETDLVTHLVVLKEQEHVGGVVGRASQWRLHIEFFRYRLDGSRFDMRFPQTNDQLRTTVRTWKCKGEVQEPFELCLELKAGGRTLKLYSREDWVIPTGVPDELRHLAQPLGALPEGDGGDVLLDDGMPLRDALPAALLE